MRREQNFECCAKEEVLAVYFQALFHDSPGNSSQPRKTSVNIDSNRDKIQTGYISYVHSVVTTLQTSKVCAYITALLCSSLTTHNYNVLNTRSYLRSLKIHNEHGDNRERSITWLPDPRHDSCIFNVNSFVQCEGGRILMVGWMSAAFEAKTQLAWRLKVWLTTL